MAIDAAEPHRAVADHRVEIGGGREALVGPAFLVPAAAEDPLGVGIGGGISGEALLQVGERGRAGEVELERAEAEPHDMAVGVDQAGQQGAPAGIDALVDLRGRASPRRSSFTTRPSSPITSPVKRCNLPARVDLDAIGIVDQRVGQERG